MFIKSAVSLRIFVLTHSKYQVIKTVGGKKNDESTKTVDDGCGKVWLFLFFRKSIDE